MKAVERPEQAGTITHLLDLMREKHVELWCEGSALRYRTSQGALSTQMRELLRMHRDEVIAHLQSTGLCAEPPLAGRRGDPSRAPLAFSQLAHWNLYRLEERPSLNVLSSATRMRGKLHPDALVAALDSLVRKHEALRTRIVVEQGVPVQRTSTETLVELEMEDLTQVPPSMRETAMVASVEARAFGPVDLRSDPLFRARLLKLDALDHVLVLSTEHIVSDGRSVGILLEDFFAEYAAALRRRSSTELPATLQIGDYADWQHRALPVWKAQHEAEWRDVIGQYPRLRFPGSRQSLEPPRGWGSFSFQIGRETWVHLREWSRLRGTTLPLSLFTAYAIVMMRMTGQQSAVLPYQTHGRFRSEADRAVGYFAVPVYPRLTVREHDSMADLLERVCEEFGHAVDRIDYSYLESRLPRPAATRNPTFNWLPVLPGDGRFGVSEHEHRLECSAVRFGQRAVIDLERDTEPVIAMMETHEGIRGWVQYPVNRISRDSIARFTENLAKVARALCEEPDRKLGQLAID